MKLDREKFLAAAMILSANSALTGCSKSTEATADEATKEGITIGATGTTTAKVNTAQAPITVRRITAPAAEGVVPAPAKEAPPPAAEGKPAVTTGGRPPGAIRIPGRLSRRCSSELCERPAGLVRARGGNSTERGSAGQRGRAGLWVELRPGTHLA
jgi:hypothetical protein